MLIKCDFGKSKDEPEMAIRAISILIDLKSDGASR
jgi:hypothetical protein